MGFRPEGLGQEAYGDPFGAGGPLCVVRARAVEGQTVRVVFDEEPVHRSALGSVDALNPTNYVFTVVVGSGTAPQPVGVKPGMVVGPAPGILTGDERAFDVQVDRPLAAGLVYQVEVVGVQSKLGGALGMPHSASFTGVVAIQTVSPPPRTLDLLDFKGNPFTGGFTFDDSGDIAPEGSQTGLRKRILRRIVTPKGAFRFLPDYGVGLRLKAPMSPRIIQDAKASILDQVKQEPEVEDAAATLTMYADGRLYVQVRARTKQGAFVDVASLHTPDGLVMIP